MEKLNFKYMLNLQLFAEPNTNVLGDSGLSAENKTFYDRVLIKEASAQLVHAQFAQKRPIPKNGGKTIEFRKFGNLPKALTPLTEGVTPDGKKLNVTAITANVDQYGDYVVISDILDMTAIDPIVVEATEIIGKQAGLTLDTVIRNELVAGTNVNYCPKRASDGSETAVTSRASLDKTCVLTVKQVQKAVAKLRANNAPTIGGSYVGIIHPYVAYDLMRDPEWQDAHKYAEPDNIFVGELGKIAGVRFVESSEAAIFFGSGCPSGLGVFATLILGANAYGDTEITGGGLQTIIKQKGSSGVADALDQRSSVGWKATKTAKILIENYIVRIESCGEYSASITAAN